MGRMRWVFVLGALALGVLALGGCAAPQEPLRDVSLSDAEIAARGPEVPEISLKPRILGFLRPRTPGSR